MPLRIIYANTGSNSNYEISFVNGDTQAETSVDLFPGTDPNGAMFANSSAPVLFTRIGNKMVFFATDATHGRELWITDGTVAGTQLLKDINVSSPTASHDAFSRGDFSFSGPVSGRLALFKGFVYFSAANDSTSSNFELWRTDGTAAGTTLFKEINASATIGGRPADFTVVNNWMYFSAFDSAGDELWKTDGVDNTAAHTFRLADIRTGDDIGNPGTPASSNPNGMTSLDGTTILFNAIDNTHGNELWKYDGSTTTMVKDIATWLPNGQTENNSSNPRFLTSIRGSSISKPTTLRTTPPTPPTRLLTAQSYGGPTGRPAAPPCSRTSMSSRPAIRAKTRAPRRAS